MPTILIVLLAAAISGLSGYYLSNKFFSSNHGKTDRSGDGGGPRGGVFALASGIFIGLVFFSLTGRLGLFTPEAVGTGMITSMIVGLVAGVIGMFRNPRSNPPAK